MFIPIGTRPRMNRGHAFAPFLKELYLPGVIPTDTDVTAGQLAGVNWVYERPLGHINRSGTGDSLTPHSSPWGPALHFNGAADAANFMSMRTDISTGADPTEFDYSEYTVLVICKGDLAPQESYSTRSGPWYSGDTAIGYMRWHDTGTAFEGYYRKSDSGATDRSMNFQANKSISADTWHHLVATGSTANTRMRCYLDGLLADTSANAPSVAGSSANRSIAGGNNDGWDGSVFMLAVWSVELSQVQIWSLYNDPLQILARNRLPTFPLPPSITSVSSDDTIGAAENPWNITGTDFGAD